MTHDRIDRAWLEAHVATLIDEGETPESDENLILYGLDSVRVMTLAGALGQRGIPVTFQDLIETPTVDAWWTLIEGRLGDAGRP